MATNTYPFAINSYSYIMDRSAFDCLGHFAEMGYGGAEIMNYPGHLWPEDADPPARRAFRARADQLGLRLISLNMPNVDLNIAAAAPEMRAYSLGFVESVVRLAGDLGVAGVVIGPGKPNPLFPAPREQLTGHFHAALDRLAPLAARAGTALWVENLPVSFLPDIGSLIDALDSYGDDAIGVVYDLANAVFVKEDIAFGLRRAKPRLRLVHLSDTGLSVYRHDPVGQGVVPFALVPPLLAEIGHGELPMLEIISNHADADIRASSDALLAMGFARDRA